MDDRLISKGNLFLDALISRKPILVSPMDLMPQLLELWRRGMPPGDKPGWASLDKLYTVQPGYMTIVTGWPGSGKSEFLDAMFVTLAEDYDWQFVMYSPENQPNETHLAKLVEKRCRKPYRAGPSERVTESEMSDAVEWLMKHFHWVRSADGSLSPKQIIIAAAEHLQKFGEKRGVVIDPWNECEHWRPNGMSETEYVSMTLSMLRNWARETKTHVWVVAHPQKMRREIDGKLPVVRPDMISGSMHWWNKADASITVHRPVGEGTGVEIQVQKMRFKHLGQVGMAQLDYDRVTGRYRDVGPIAF